MKNIKVVIILLAVIVIFLLITIFIIQKGESKNETNIGVYQINSNNAISNVTEETPVLETEEEYVEKASNTLEKVTLRYNFYAVQNCVNKFYLFWNYLSEGEDYKEALYSLLDEEYTNLEGVTQDNLLEKLGNYSESKVTVTHMYAQDIPNNVTAYIVTGYTRNIETSEINEFIIMLKIDMVNKTFTILPYEYMEAKGYTNLYIGQTLNINTTDEIENKKYNIFDASTVSDEEYIQDLFSQYKENALYNKTVAYSLLDNNLKATYFPTFESYSQYIKNNTRNIVMLKPEQYKKSKGDNDTKYICIDANGNKYTFNETAVMEYTLSFDIE